MKKTLFFLRLFLCLIQANAASTAYFKVANTGTLMKIEKVSTGGYITIGTDSVYKMEVIRWDNSFNPVWSCKFTDANLVPFFPAIVEANDGSFYMMMYSHAHSDCATIVKFSSNGVMQWQKNYYDGFGSLNSFSLAKGAGTDNGFIFTCGNNYLVKCDANGNIVWQNIYYYPLASGFITPYSIMTDGINYVVSSSYNINSLLTFRIDGAGTVLAYTAYTYSTMQIRPTRIVKLNSSGGYAIVGNYNNSNNNQTEFLAILSNNLTMTSFNELTISGYDQFELYDIAAINNGQNLILDGSIYINSTAYIAMMNVANNGTIVWKTLATGNSGMPFPDVEFRGVTSLGNSTLHVGYGVYEGAVVSIIDSAGNGLCNTLPFNVTNVPRTLALQSSTLSVIPAAVLTDSAAYAYNTNVYTTQYFYCGSLATAVNEIENSSMQIFPNPAASELRIQSEEFRIKNVEIVNVFGQRVYNSAFNIMHSALTIDVSSLAPGIYFVRLTSEKEQVVRKVTVQR